MQVRSKKQSFFSTEINEQSQRRSIKKLRSNFSNLEEEKEMAQKAQQFIAKLRANKKQFDGKIHMIKRAETKKRQEQQKRKQIQKELQIELKRRIRRVKAEVNIEFYKEKQGILSQKNMSEASSPRKRTLSLVSQQSQGKLPRVRLPSVYNQSGLQQIREESDKVPLGIQKSLRKQIGLIKRAHTQKSDYVDKDEGQEIEQAEELKLRSGSKRSPLRFRMRSEESDESKEKDDNKKLYLMSRNHTNDVSEYLAQYTNLGYFQKLGSQSKYQKKVSQFKNVMKTKKTPRVNLKNSVKKQLFEFQPDQEENLGKNPEFQQNQDNEHQA